MGRGGRDMRRMAWALVLALTVMLAVFSAQADANVQVEALRQLYRELNLGELPETARCDNGDGCGHVYIDADGRVKALCPFGAYMLTFDQPRLMATRPIDLILKPGNNLIDRGTSYLLTGGYSDTTVTVAQLRSVSLNLSNGNINQLVLSAGSAVSLTLGSNARVGTVKPVSATLNAVGSLSLDQLGESDGNPGTVTITGSGVISVGGTLFSVLSPASAGDVVLRAGTLPPAAVAGWKALTLSSGSFDGVTSLTYNGTAYPLCIQRGTGVVTGYAPLPDLEAGESYRAAVTGAAGESCAVALIPAPGEFVIDSTGGTLAVTNKGVLKSVSNANQDVALDTSEIVEAVSAQTSGRLWAGAGRAAKLRFNGENSFHALTVPSGASLTLSGSGRINLGDVTCEGSLTVSRSTGVVRAESLSGAGSIAVDGQTNLSLDAVNDLNGGALKPTRIRILTESGTVANTKIQLKLGTGESFTTATDGNGLVTLWRSAQLKQVDVVALSGGDTYTAVIQEGGADADALPVIQSVTLDKQGNVVINATGAKSYGVQYVVGSQNADIKDAYDDRALRAKDPDGKNQIQIPGLREGDQITIRAYAAKEAGAELTAATSDAFAFSGKQGIVYTGKTHFHFGKINKIYNAAPFGKPGHLPTRYENVEYQSDGQWRPWLHNGAWEGPTDEGSYPVRLTVKDDDPTYLAEVCEGTMVINRMRVLVIVAGAYKQKHDEDPEPFFETIPEELYGDDMIAEGGVGRTPGESYGNHRYDVEKMHAVDIDGNRVDHYHFVMSPSSGCLFIDWDYHHFLPVDRMSYIDPIYEEAEFSDGSKLRFQYRTSEVLNLGGTYMGTLVRDSETGKPKPYTPSLRIRRGYDEALLILTADAEIRKDGGYETDRDGNRVWGGRTLTLGYWQLSQLKRRHIQYAALSLKGSALMVSLEDLTGPETEALITEKGLKKRNIRFCFEIVPVLEAGALREDEAAAKPLFAGQPALARMAAYIEYGNQRIDLPLPNAWMLMDAASLLDSGAPVRDAGVVETVGGLPVTREDDTRLTPEESAAAQSLLGNRDLSEEQRELAYTLLEKAVVRNGGAMERYDNGGPGPIESDIVVPYTASERRIMDFAALMRTRPFFIASYQEGGLYGLRMP